MLIYTHYDCQLKDNGFNNIALYQNDSVIINQKYKIKVGKLRNTLSLFEIKKDRKFNMDKINYRFIDMSYSSKMFPVLGGGVRYN